MTIRIATTLAIACCTLPLLAHSEDGGGTNSLAYKANEQAARPLAPHGPTTVEEMEAFVDGFMDAQMKAGPVAGATVIVVKDGQVFFQKGYGYEDVDKQVPVDPAQTLFRPGSVSKLFTWTSIMQLVEQGKLDLDADVNTYLKDFKVANTYPQPVTLRNIMTHTAGFEDGAVGYLFANKVEDLVPLGDWVAAHPPARVRPPTTDFSDGTHASYSNWATALAGHIIEIVSGQPFDDYVAQHIFQPLGMTRSTFGEPLPDALAPRMSVGYTPEAGGFKSHGFEFIHAAGPAGSLSSTAADMGRFMLAHLQDGALGDGRILKPETAQMMHTRVMSPDPALNGHCLGFYETYINGRRIIGHGGDTGFFHSVLSLMPETGIGLFASVNTGGKGGRTSVELERAFFKHYFPAELPAVKPPADAAKRNARYAGSYRSLRHSYTKFEKVFSAFGDENVTAMPDGTLLMGDIFGNPARWVEVGDGVFRMQNGDAFAAFKGDDGGRATHVVGLFPPIVAQRISWYETGKVHGFIVGVAILLCITILVSAIRQRRVDRQLAGNLRWARPALALSAGLLLLFLVAIGLILAGGFENLLYKIPTSLRVALTFPLLAIPFALLAAWFAVSVWRSRTWTFGSRLHYSLAAVAVLAFLVVLNYWNLLGYRFG
ncbi:MAG TPA: serine hydrolase domain-containing protein [Steroidobacteraceae bacterium]|jgi:CubicO group peptidase (beta-lactamase class C family)|nr:serine hydrolase domain-containing protein [Steroidobacteraceae bacterium]